MQPRPPISIALLGFALFACGSESEPDAAAVASSGGAAALGGTGGTGSTATAATGGTGQGGTAGAAATATGGSGADGGSGAPPASGGDGGAADVTRPPGPLTEYGFEIGLPQVHSLTCDPDLLGAPREVPDADWLCTFDHDDVVGTLYVQATAVSCTYRYTISTVFETRGWLSIDGAVTELESVTYDWGDYHHIDTLTFTWSGLEFTYGHSSLYNYRICAPMDCMQVRPVGGDLSEDGCTAERTHPITCVPILADGTHAELVDTFVGCES